MKIKSIRMYQAVTIGGKVITHLGSEPSNHDLVKGARSLEFVEQGVLIVTETDAAIVSFNNLSMIQIDRDSLNSSEKSEKPKLAKAKQA